MTTRRSFIMGSLAIFAGAFPVAMSALPTRIKAGDYRTGIGARVIFNGEVLPLGPSIVDGNFIPGESGWEKWGAIQEIDTKEGWMLSVALDENGFVITDGDKYRMSKLYGRVGWIPAPGVARFQRCNTLC